MRVEVEVARCRGHGRCYDLMPDVFEPDPRGRVVLAMAGELAADMIPYTRVAVANCPEAALRVVEADDTDAPTEAEHAH